jgi:hypothetical protein
MSWNYRLLKQDDCYQIVECYYEEDGITPRGYIGTDIFIDNKKDIDRVLKMLKSSVKKPALTLDGEGMISGVEEEV